MTGAAPVRIPVMATLLLAFRFVWGDRQSFWYTAFLPVLVLAALDVALVATMVETPEGPRPWFLVQVLSMVANLLLETMFAVAWHRRWLVPDENVTYGTALKWDSRKSRFLMRLVGIFLCVFAVALPLSMIMGAMGFGVRPDAAPRPEDLIAALILMAVSIVIVARLYVLLPAAAVDDQLTFVQAWQLTRRNTWRMILVVVVPAALLMLCVLIVHLVLEAVFGAVGLSQSLVATFVLGFLVYTTGFFFIAVGVSALSIAYQHLKEVHGAGALQEIPEQRD